MSKLDAHEIAYYAVRGTSRDPVKDVEDVEKMIEEYAARKSNKEIIVAELKEKIEKLYITKFSGTGLTEDECDMVKAAHNDAIALVIDQLEGNLVDELS